MVCTTEVVQHTESIADVYPSDDDGNVVTDQGCRWTCLVKRFKQVYKSGPDFVARSPGRVNIIGEHIDYSLYDVFPAALQVDVLIAMRTVKAQEGKPMVQLTNIDETKFATREFTIPAHGDIEIDANRQDWSNYFKAGMLVALKFLREKVYGGGFVPSSMEVLVDGNVPPGGGLSSSAAFVCASALAVAKAHGHAMTKQELFDIALVSERSVGVYSGG